MFRKKQEGPREQYRGEEAQRVDESPTLATRFPKLKSLTADVYYTDAGKSAIDRHIKYQINLEAAKSVFRFNCPNNECIRGDFDLSGALANAVADLRTRVDGEMPCHGWLSKSTIDTVHCRHTLHYRLNLEY